MISIIIPVYNVADYLEECIASIVVQTYKDLEIILVDDGSTDSSGKICDKWAEKDARIRVIHKKNGGMSDARNAGLDIAKGELIGFIDSDDVIRNDMYERLYALMEEHKAEISCCNFQKEETFPDISILGNDTQDHVQTYTAREALEATIKETDLHPVLWNKLYTREIVGDVRFEYGKYHEDEFWIYQVVTKATKIVSTSRVYYGYRQRANSIMHQKYSLKRLDILEARAERLDFIEKNFPELLKKARCDFRFMCIRERQLGLLNLNENELEVSKKTVMEAVKKYPLKYSDYKELPLGRKVWCFLSNVNFEATCKIRNRFHYGP